MLKKLLGILGRPKAMMTPPPTPKEMKEIGDYKVHFQQAVSFTESLGFDAPKINWINHDVLGTDGNFFQRAGAAANLMDFSGSAGQCLKWCHYIRPYIEKELGVPVWLTIGQLWAFDKIVFDPSWEDFRKWSKSGICLSELIAQGRTGVNLHAWLTVATGEIIEPTLMSSMALVQPKEADSLNGAITWGRDPGLITNHRYYPMVAGDAIAEAVNQNPQLPLLAKCREDLFKIQMYFHSN